MEEKKRQLIILCTICVQLTLMGCEEKEVKFGTEFRPSDFPINVFPPENASNVRYASPETARIAKGCYSISYVVNEEYPAEKSINAIHDIMLSKGYVKVEWSSEDFAVYMAESEGEPEKYMEIPEETELLREILKKETDLAPNNKHLWTKAKSIEGKPGWLFCVLREEWITENDDLVDIKFSYTYPAKQEKGRNLSVNIHVFTPSSWRYPYVKKYKELHSFLFKENETDSPGARGTLD